MEDCVFCKIVNGQLPSAKIWEDDEFIAILDLFPNTKGMSLVIPKKHYHSYAFEMPDDVYSRFMLAGRKVGLLLDEKLHTQRTTLVMEGMGINHAHLKLYPMHGLKEKFTSMDSHADPVYFETYQGYTTTRLGPQADGAELQRLAAEIAAGDGE